MIYDSMIVPLVPICNDICIGYIYILKTIDDNMMRIEYIYTLNLFTTIHDGNFRRHSSMNVTIK